MHRKMKINEVLDFLRIDNYLVLEQKNYIIIYNNIIIMYIIKR